MLSKNIDSKVYIALLIVSILYGLNYIIAKDVMPAYLEATTFITLRLMVCTLLFWILGFLFPKERISKKDLPLIIWCSFLGAAFNQLTFFKGLSLTSPINASLIMILVPIMVFVIAVGLGNEQWQLKKGIGILAGFLGSILIISKGSFQGLVNLDFSKGDVFVFLNATSFALYLVFSKSLVTKYSPIFLMKWMFLFAVIMILPFTFKQIISVQYDSFPSIIWIKMAYVILGATFSVYILNAYALSKVNPTVVGTFIYLQPFFATLFSILLKKDKLDALKIVAGSFIFFGVYLVNNENVNKLKKLANK